MCTFTFLYTDGKTVRCEHIKWVSYRKPGGSGRIDVTEESLLAHAFPLVNVISLRGETQSFCVTGDGLRCIQVTAE